MEQGKIKRSGIYFDSEPIKDSENAVLSGGVYNIKNEIKNEIESIIEEFLKDIKIDFLNNFILSDWEDVTLPLTRADAELHPCNYDGFYIINKDETYDTLVYTLINNEVKMIIDDTSQSQNDRVTVSIVLPFRKGDIIWVSRNATSYHNIPNRVAYYKLRDYSNR